MTQEFVTLPREVVEQAIDALYCTNSQEGSPTYNFELKAVKELRAALEQLKNHVPGAGNMVPAGWKLVPSDATHKWVENLADRGMRISGLASAISDMLAAAPQPPTTEQSSAVEQPQGEQEPVATVNRLGTIYLTQAGCGMQPGTRLYTHPKPKREPLTAEQWTQKLGDRQLFTILEAIRFVEKEYGIEAAHNIK